MPELALSSLSDRYAFCDPASGKQPVKRTRARSAVVVVAADDLERVYVIHAWAERCPTDRLIEKIFDVNATYHPRVFGCEANAMQALFADALAREARFKGVSLPLTAVVQPTKIDKDFRIRAMLQPVIANGRLFVQAHQHELKAELASFPMAPVKDLVDALASAIGLIPPRPAPRQRSAERDALAAYLRASGASPSHIERRLAELGAAR